MATTNTDDILDHEYDGIHEYDNPIPGWWNWIFAGSIIFSVMYVWFWHTASDAWTIQEAWDQDQVVAYRRIFGQMGELRHDQDTILSMMANPQMMAVAKSIFVGNCAACHAKDGGGINGVNLTDDAYKNVVKIEDIFNTITKGANSGAMPSWEQRLQPNERIIMAAYVASLRGTHPANPKAAEGNPIPPWPTPAIAPPKPAAPQPSR